MTLLLTESEVRQLLTMEDALKSVEDFFRHKDVDAISTPRTRSITDSSVLNVMHASLPYLGRAGVKAYLSTALGTKFVLLLYDLKQGELLAVIGAENLGRYRTGAASGVATKYLCGLKSFKLGLAGSGTQAVTQVVALAKVANLEKISVWSPTPSARERFARAMTKELGVDCRASDSVAEAFKGCEVATTITSATKPFVTRESLDDVSHINACGSNRENRAELTSEAVSLFSTICVDDLAQSRVESGDLILAAREAAFRWEDSIELCEIVRKGLERRGKTLFKSNGVAGEDVALASMLYDRAAREGRYERAFDFFS